MILRRSLTLPAKWTPTSDPTSAQSSKTQGRTEAHRALLTLTTPPSSWGRNGNTRCVVAHSYSRCHRPLYSLLRLRPSTHSDSSTATTRCTTSPSQNGSRQLPTESVWTSQNSTPT